MRTTVSSIRILPALAALPLLAGLLGGCGYGPTAQTATVGPAPDNAPLVAIEKFKAPTVLATNAPMPGETFARATHAMAFGENSTVGGVRQHGVIAGNAGPGRHGLAAKQQRKHTAVAG